MIQIRQWGLHRAYTPISQAPHLIWRPFTLRVIRGDNMNTDFQTWFYDTISETEDTLDHLKLRAFDDKELLLWYGLLNFLPLHLLIQTNQSFRQGNDPVECRDLLNTLSAFLIEIPFIKRIPALYEITKSKELCLGFIYIALFKDRIKKEILKRMSQHGMSRATVKYLLYQDSQAIQFLFYAMVNTLSAWKEGKPSKLLIKALKTPYAVDMILMDISDKRFTQLNKIWEKQQNVLALVSEKVQIDPFPKDWEKIELPINKDTSPPWKEIQSILLRICLTIAWNWYPALQGKFDDIQFKVFNREKDRYEQAKPEIEIEFVNLDLKEVQSLSYEESHETYSMPTLDEILDYVQHNYKGPLVTPLCKAIWFWCIEGLTQEEAARKAGFKNPGTFKNILSKLVVRNKIKNIS